MNSKTKRNAFVLSLCGGIFLICIIIIYLLNQKSPYEYLKSKNGTATQINANEFLDQVHIDNKYIIFFINEHGNVACAVMKKKFLSYEILKISSELSARKDNENYLFSAYEDNGYEWIDWGLISENNTKKVLSNGTEMNIIDNLQYSFRICWIMGSGEENTPPLHEEIKNGAAKNSPKDGY